MKRTVLVDPQSLLCIYAETVARLGWDPTESAFKWSRVGRDPWHKFDVEPVRDPAYGLSAAEPVAYSVPEPVATDDAAEAPVILTGNFLI